MTIRTAADNKSTILQVAGVDKLKINDTGVVEADYFKTPAGVLSPVGSFKNKIINGDFSIWQRGTSQATGVSGYGSADRWAFANVGDGVRIVGQTAVYHANDGGFVNSALTNITQAPTGASHYIYQEQRIEGVRTLAGKTVTLSFYANRGSGAGDIAVEVLQQFGSGGSPSSNVSIPLGRVTPNVGDLTRHELTFDLPSVAGKTLGTDNNDRLTVIFWMSAGSNYSTRTSGLGHQMGGFNITGVQLEEGTYATPFEFRPISIEQLLCYRYFWVHPEPVYFNTNALSTPVASSSAVVRFPVAMRVTPTVSSGAGENYSGLTTTYSTPRGVRWNATATAGGATAVVQGPVILDAEL